MRLTSPGRASRPQVPLRHGAPGRPVFGCCISQAVKGVWREAEVCTTAGRGVVPRGPQARLGEARAADRAARGAGGDCLRAGCRVHDGCRAGGCRAPGGGRVAGGGAVRVCTDKGRNEVSQFATAGSGVLRPLTPKNVASGPFPYGIAVSPQGSSVYTVDVGPDSKAANEVSQYRISQATGKLTPMSPRTVAAPAAPAASRSPLTASTPTPPMSTRTPSRSSASARARAR
jgi:hypothetical protein